MGWLGQFARDIIRQVTTPGAGAPLSGANTTAAAGISMESSTTTDLNGEPLDLFIIGHDEIGDATKYLGDDPIEVIEL